MIKETRDYLIKKLCLSDDSKIWYRNDKTKFTVNAAESVGIEELTEAAERFIEMNAITEEPAKLSLLDTFLSEHILSDEEVQQLKEKTDFSKDESEGGQCPKCGSENLEYGSFEVDADCICYPWTCEKCGSEGAECGVINFDGHRVDHISTNGCFPTS
jgi:predicted nucleic-acid-binding Zn-ribbon protein